MCIRDSGNTGSITITDGSNQNISIAPNGSGSVVVTTKLDITGADGLILENGPTNKVLVEPDNEYTKHLLSCIPPWLGE